MIGAIIVSDVFRSGTLVLLTAMIVLAWMTFSHQVPLAIGITLGYLSGAIALCRHFGDAIQWWRTPLLFVGALVLFVYMIGMRKGR